MDWIYQLLLNLYNAFISPLLVFFDDYGFDIQTSFKFGFGGVTWFDITFYYLFLIVFVLFVFVLLMLFLYKVIKWLFSIPKKIGGIR